MSKPTLKFLDWSQPLVKTAALRLREQGRGDFPADFSHLHVVVPTAEAGRLLREALAVLCAKAGGAVNLRISRPEQLIRRPATASEPQVQLAWLRTLRHVADKEKSKFQHLFRNDVLTRFERSIEIFLGWGETLQQCRKSLAGEGLELAGVAEKLNVMNGEEAKSGRFTDLLALEKIYLDTLSGIAGDAPDPAVALLGAIKAPSLPEGVEKVILIDCADLAGAPRRFLEKLDGVAVECWVNAPEELCGQFDGFGCPLPKFWNDVTIDLEVDKCVRIVPRPDQQARKILDLLLAAAKNGASPSAVGVLDPEVADALEVRAELAAGRAPDRNGVPKIFVPREIPLAELPWSQLLRAIVRLAGDPTVAAAAEIWRSPLFADYAAARKVDVRKALELLDELRGNNFVDDAGFLDRLLEDRRAAVEADLEKAEDGQKPYLFALLARIDALRELARFRADWRARLAAAEDLATGAFVILGEIGGSCLCRHLDISRSESELRSLSQVVAEIAALKIPKSDRFRLTAALLKRRMAAVTVSPPGEGAVPDVDAVGFLELPWRDDKTMLIAGFNEESFDVGGSDDIFLPDDARSALGMMTRDKRRAADALRFAALVRSRDLYILCGRSSQSGETLFPSRLLFRCAEPELPQRVSDLLGAYLVEEPPPPAGGMPPFLPRAVPKGEMKKRMSITGFSAYLKCPESFYLENVLGFRRQDPDPPELDMMAWGTFTHEVLQECPRTKAELAPGASLEATVLDTFDKKMTERFGEEPPGLVKLQCGMIRDSLKYFAKVQNAEFDAGWEIVTTEYSVNVTWGELYKAVFPGKDPGPLRGGIVLSGQIDRIDRRPAKGGGVELRVLDYKTKKNSELPKKSHLVSPQTAPMWAEDRRALDEVFKTTGKIKTYYWTDLQLPLYVLLAKHILPALGVVPQAKKISAGYFNLPLELTDTGIRIFEELDDPAVLESAVRCADRLLHKIFEEQIFRPAAKDVFPVYQDSEIAMAQILDPFSNRSGS